MSVLNPNPIHFFDDGATSFCIIAAMMRVRLGIIFVDPLGFNIPLNSAAGIFNWVYIAFIIEVGIVIRRGNKLFGMVCGLMMAIWGIFFYNVGKLHAGEDWSYI
ncbi:MAG: hypothetical protein ACFFD2_10590 [Promethearchaeota archaeon]